MTTNLLQTPEYRALIQSHIFKTIQYLFDKDQEFAIACEVKYITFSPELPTSIKSSFDDTVLFILRGFTFESAQITEESFSFEAGFGNENFGSVVSMPLLAIKQIFVGEHPIVINLADPEMERKKKKEESASTKSSMEALLKNPENKKLLKTKK
ncbi:MAG TPA: hypothetical protein VIN02_07530 [Sulfurovum sp.]|jgi:hypothetical protein